MWWLAVVIFKPVRGLEVLKCIIDFIICVLMGFGNYVLHSHK